MSHPPIRVMVVEDSAVVRGLLVHIITQDNRLQVVAAVGSAEEALAEVGRVRPDVISMDIRLPGMDGLEATRRLMTSNPTPIVVIADAVEDETLNISMNALKAGALAVVEKPLGVTAGGYEALSDMIRTQLRIMSEVPVIRRREPSALRFARNSGEGNLGIHGILRPTVIGMAASTGGPPALAKVLGMLPVNFNIPILVVQHMGAAFMEGFTHWLDGQTPLEVRLGSAGVIPAPGCVYVAPGNKHLAVGVGNALRLLDGPPVGGQLPSANVLLESIAQYAGPGGLGILLTGMGEDGARGIAAVRHAGGYTITEDESSCVVYGMPAAAKRLGGSCISLPHNAIAPLLMRITQHSAS